MQTSSHGGNRRLGLGQGLGDAVLPRTGGKIRLLDLEGQGSALDELDSTSHRFIGAGDGNH
jgi:hypothetical protein